MDYFIVAFVAACLTSICWLIYFNHDQQKWIDKVNAETLKRWEAYNASLAGDRRPIPPPSKWGM